MDDFALAAASDAERINTYVMEFQQERTIDQAQERGQRIEEEPTVDVKLPNTSGNQIPQQTDQRLYLTVPYAEKDDAKALGAKWDREAKSWYVPAGADIEPLRRWMPALRESETPSTQDPREAFKAVLSEAGFRIDGLPQMDGAMHRVPVEGDKARERSGAYVGHLDGRPAGYMQNFRTGQKGTWKMAGEFATALEYAKLAADAAERRAEREQQLQLEYAAAAQRAEAQFDGAAEAAEHPYLQRKGVEAHGVRIGAPGQTMETTDADGSPKTASLEGRLIVPVRDIDGKLWSFQTIDADGTKGFMKSGRTQGGMHQIGDIEKPGPVIIAEGYSTGATLHELTDTPVVVAFNAGNLLPVAEAIRARYPEREIVVAGDNDHDKFYPDGKSRPNVGADAAQHAAKAVSGLAVIPGFKPDDPGTDWNDKLGALQERREAQAEFEAETMMAREDRWVEQSRERIEQSIETVQRTARHTTMDGAYESRVLVGHSKDGYHHALDISRQGGDLGEPLWSDALATQEAALEAGERAEQHWIDTYEIEQTHSAEHEIGM